MCLTNGVEGEGFSKKLEDIKQLFERALSKATLAVEMEKHELNRSLTPDEILERDGNCFCPDDDHANHNDCNMFCHLSIREGKRLNTEMKMDFKKENL